MFGRFAVKDNRDYKAKLCGNVWSAPKYWYSAYFGDQGKTSACVGFAWMHWLECDPHRQYLDPFGVYEMAKFLDEWEGTNYDGTSCRAGAKLLQKLGYLKTYAWFETVEEISNFVCTHGPVVLGINWYSKMMAPNKHNVIVPKGKLIGGHAVLCDGCNEDKLRLKNSWSRKWGKKGRAFIAKEDLQRLLNEDGEACSGVEVDVNATIR